MTTPQEPNETPENSTGQKPPFPNPSNPFAAPQANYNAQQPAGYPHGQPQFTPQGYPQNFGQIPQEPKKNSGCLKWGLIIVGIFVLLTIISVIIVVVALVYNSDSSSSSQGTSTTQNADTVGGTQNADNLSVGDTFNGSDGLKITVSSFEVVETPILGPHSCALITYVNEGSGEANFEQFFDWSLQNPSGVIDQPTYAGENDLQSGKLAPGGTVSGNVCFDTTEPGEYSLTYEPTLSLLSTDKATWKAPL